MTQEKAAAKDFFGLKAKRESLGMTLKDVFTLTRISVVNLEAIENGDFHALPVAIYAKNFIRIYAQILDLDSQPILDSYEAYWKTPQADQSIMPVKVQEREQNSEYKDKPKIIPEPEKKINPEEPVLKKSTSNKKVFLALTVAIVIVIAAAIAIFHEQQPLPNAPVNRSQVSGAPSAPQVAITTPPSPTPANSSVNLPAQPAQVSEPSAAVPPASKEITRQLKQPLYPEQKSVTPVKASVAQNVPAANEKKEQVSADNESDILVIKATEPTWLKIKTDQNPPFQVLLKPGQAVKRKGAGFSIDIGNAGGVTIQFKGKTIENLGKSGEVRHLQLP